MGSEHLPKAFGFAPSLRAAVDRGAEFGMALLVAREAEGCGRRGSGVVTGGAGGWSSNRHVHPDAAAEVFDVACSEVGMKDEMVDGIWRKT